MQDISYYKVDLEICPTALMIVASDGEIVRTNRRLDELFGYRADELAGQRVEVLVPLDVRGNHPDLRDAFFEMPTSRSMGTGRDLHGVMKGGAMIPVEVGLEPLEFGGRTMVMVSVLDIRERKNSEAMIRRAIDSASSAMIQVDQDGAIELVNSRAVALFGYETSELLGQPIEMLIPERFRRKHTVFRASYQISRETRSMGSGRELFGLRRDGSEFPIEIGLNPIHESASHSTMATIIDISDRQRRTLHMRQKNAQLRRLNTELLEFAYSASHDLKAPLASIAGLLEFCQQDLAKGDTDEVRDNLEKSKALVERLAARVEAMLSLAKTEVGPSDWEPVSVADSVRDAWGAIPHEGVELTTSFEHKDPIQAVKSKVDTILENLLSNAVKFRDGSKPVCTVSVSTWSSGEDFCLAVEDNGVGIPEGEHEKVFRLFRRIGDRTAEGTGLGLPLVKKCVVRLGGSVHLESADGSTTFTVTLPQVVGEAPDAKAPDAGVPDSEGDA